MHLTRILPAALAAGLALSCEAPGGSASGGALDGKRTVAFSPGGACYAHTYLGNHPDEQNPGWHSEAQGLTHGPDHWYATQNIPVCVFPLGDPLCPAATTTEGCVLPAAFCLGFGCPVARQGVLWRIPVEHDLAAGAPEDIAVITAEVCEQGLHHFGAPAFHEHEGTGFVLVPVDGNGAAVAAFASDPAVGMVAWSFLPAAGEQSGAGWLAVDGDGLLWAGENQEPFLTRYTVDWAALRDAGELILGFHDRVPLEDESGAPLALVHEQGGAFAEVPALPAPLLYLTNGLDDAGCDCGIHVLEVRDAAGGGACLPSAPCVARRVDRSTNGSGPFNFQFDPTAPYYEEPEGITFWDLDADPRSPGVSGQVHVILLDNDEPDSDDVYVKHYRLGTETEPPAVTCPADVVVECTGDGGIRRDDPQLAGFLGGATAEDACDAAPAVANDVPALLPLGTTPVTFTATDDFGNAASCVASVTVVDTASPTVQVSLSPHHLWPPNHKMVEVTATVIMADGCDPAPSFVLSSVASSEPDDGRGDGHTGGDIQGVALGTPDTSFLVRAERAGGGPGRIYTATFSAFDGTGNGAAATGTAIVSKP